MAYFIDLNERVFSRLTVLRRGEDRRDPRGKVSIYWVCACSCSPTEEFEVVGASLRNGTTGSCGCLQLERVRAKVTTHGHTGGAYRTGQTLAYGRWKGMRNRCNNPKNPSYKNYGGRGINVCPDWDCRGGFQQFFKYMGECPLGMTIERIDNDGNYEPGNVRWASRHDQARNYRRNIQVSIAGKTQVLKDWCHDLGVGYDTVLKRVTVKGMDPIEALRLSTGRIDSQENLF